MKSFFTCFFLLIIVSCTSKNSIPKDVLPQPRMQALLWDIVRADEFALNFVKEDSLHRRLKENTRLYDEIFSIHKTDREQFKRSINFYSSHPDLLKVIFDSLENKKTFILQAAHQRPVLADSSHKLRFDSIHRLRVDSMGRLRPDSIRKKVKKAAKKHPKLFPVK